VTVDGVVLEEDYIQGSTTLNPDRFDYPLTIPEGYVFLMGDNREHSTDSRSEMMGLVPVESIVGKVRLRFLPFGSIKFYE
jgi:signal peptidase I